MGRMGADFGIRCSVSSRAPADFGPVCGFLWRLAWMGLALADLFALRAWACRRSDPPYVVEWDGRDRGRLVQAVA